MKCKAVCLSVSVVLPFFTRFVCFWEDGALFSTSQDTHLQRSSMHALTTGLLGYVFYAKLHAMRKNDFQGTVACFSGNVSIFFFSLSENSLTEKGGINRYLVSPSALDTCIE